MADDRDLFLWLAMRSLLLVIFTTAALFAKAQSITTRDKGATLTYAKQELQEFLKKYPAAKDLDITLKTDTTLAEASYQFEITGPIAPKILHPIAKGKRVITPAVKLRGIRQHINFPMDISSYPIEEAKEYIRNLTRLRFNYIVFHSYPYRKRELRQQKTFVTRRSSVYLPSSRITTIPSCAAPWPSAG